MNCSSDEIFWSRRQWGNCCGFFLMRFANIETEINCLKLYLNAIEAAEKNKNENLITEPSKSWQGLNYEEKIDKILTQAQKLSFTKIEKAEFKSDLGGLLLRAKGLKDIRNTLAHGAFVIKDGHTPEAPNFGVFSRALKNAYGMVSENAKVLHASDLKAAISETTHVEIGISSRIKDILSVYSLQKIDAADDVPFEARALETQLSLALGAFVVHMGEIECMVHLVYQCILDPEYESGSISPKMKLDGYWDTLQLSEKLEDLVERLPKSDGNYRLRQVLSGIQESSLIKSRNLLAHAKVCHQASAETEKLELIAIRHTRQGAEIIPADAVRCLILAAAKCSDDLSESLSIARMALMKPFISVKASKPERI